VRENTEPEDAEAGREAALRRALDDRLAGAASGEGEPEPEGLALLDRERWAEAAEVLEEDLRRAEHEAAEHGGEAESGEHGGERRTVLRARLNLARALTGAGDLDRAIELLGPLPDEFAALPDPDDDDRARALSGLGEAYLRAHRPVAATNFFGQALEIFRRLDAADRQAAMFARIAEAARLRGDRAAEQAALLRAESIKEGAPLDPPSRPG
jgi:tetratricopeptide (TPR) repeat protein